MPAVFEPCKKTFNERGSEIVNDGSDGGEDLFGREHSR